MQPDAQANLTESKRQLVEQARRSADRTRELARRRALMILFVSLLATAAVLIALDAILRREETGLRVLFAIAFWSVAGYVTFRVVRPAWRFAPTWSDAARWVENANPRSSNVNDLQLSAMVELASIPEHDTRYGSSAFRDRALQQTLGEQLKTDWAGHLSLKAVSQWAIAAGMIILGAILSTALWPSEVWVGVQRFAMPFKEVQWPRADQLVLQELPNAIPYGSALQVEVTDRNPPLPLEVELQSRLLGDSGQVFATSMTTVADTAIASLPPAERSFEIRVVGGDDETMPWQTVQVVHPPEFSQYVFSVVPPQYVRGEAKDIVGKRIKVLEGSRVGFQGELDEPVAAIRVRPVPNDDLVEGEGEKTWAVKLGNDGRSVSIESNGAELWLATESVTWQYELKTLDGLEIATPGVWSVEVARDMPPIAILEEPPMPFLSPKATIPLIGMASDDLEVVRISAFVAQVDESTGEDAQANRVIQEIPVWKRQATAGKDNPMREVPFKMEASWRDLPAFSPGDRLSVWLEVEDSKGQVVESQPRVLLVREPEELASALDDLSSTVAESLANLVESQRRNSQLANRTAELVTRTEGLSSEQVEAFSNISQIQGSIRRQLAEGKSSILGELIRIREQFRLNGLEETQAARMIEAISETVGQIDATAMRAAMQAAFDSQQIATSVAGDSMQVDAPEVLKSLSALKETQATVLQQLQLLQARLARSELAKDVQSELQDLLSQQQELKGTSDELQLDILTNTVGAVLDAKQTALSVDQQELARELDALVQRVRLLAETDGQTEAKLKTVRSAVDLLVSRRTSTTMRNAADSAAIRELKSTIESQSQAIVDLNDALLESGASRSISDDIKNRARQLEQVSRELNALVASQAALAEDIAARNDSAQAISKRQQTLYEASLEKSLELESLGEWYASESIDAAAALQEDARESLDVNDLSAAAKPARTAAAILAQIANELKEKSQQLTSEARQQQIFQLEQKVELMIAEQAGIVQELAELAPTANAGTIVERQDGVRADLDATILMVSDLPTFQWTFEQASLDMVRTSAAARRQRIRPDAVRTAESALAKLQLAAEAIATESPDTEQADESPSGADEESGDSRLVPPLASLKLLRSLQLDINDRTRQLSQSETKGPLHSQQLAELANQQRALGLQLELLLKELDDASDAKNTQR